MEKLQQIHQSIITSKELLRTHFNVKKNFELAQSNIKKEVDNILEMQHKEIPVIPEIDYKSIVNGNVSFDEIVNIKRRGALIIRNVFDDQQANEWNDEVGEYILSNDYFTKSVKREGMDQYFSQLKSGAPQIFGIYWSRPQMLARQSQSMSTTKKFLNSMWNVKVHMVMSLIPTMILFMQIEFVEENQVMRRLDCHLILMEAHLNAGLTLPFKKSMDLSLMVT